MPTNFSFSQKIFFSDLKDPARSVGSHLAAKLQTFGTDERTLTDELCDMLCIWLGIQATGHSATASTPPFVLTLSKTTTSEEVLNGADLELIVSTPLGSKRCLIQAKVVDPVSKKLRCDSKEGWKKLRSQLVSARNEVGELAFLMLYVPSGVLSGKRYGYSTYEQAFLKPNHGHPTSCRGVTLIAVNDLLLPSGLWRNTKFKVKKLKPGEYQNGTPFWRVLLELMLCKRSSWSPTPVIREEDTLATFRRLTFGATSISKDGWKAIQDSAEQWLSGDDDSDNSISQ